MTELLVNFIEIFTDSAPWLLLGLLVAGIMQWLVPLDLLHNQLGASDFKSILKAAIIGAPLPLCSCGVIPAAIGLRRAGASKPATVSFLVATPETGVDSISVSYALLGPFMAIIRPISAIFSAVYAGLLVMFGANSASSDTQTMQEHDSGECCAHKKATPEPAENCCAGEKGKTNHGWLWRIGQVFVFASGKLLADISKWLLIGLAVAAAIKTWVPTDFLTQWGSGLMAMLVMALIGVPMYICATASTPIAAGFLAAGVSPGAVLVFMLAGPATNLSTMGMIRQEMGSRVLAAYLIALFSASISIGYLVNWMVAKFGFYIAAGTDTHLHGSDSWVYQASAILLALLMLRLALRKLWRSLHVHKHTASKGVKMSRKAG